MTQTQVLWLLVLLAVASGTNSLSMMRQSSASEDFAIAIGTTAISNGTSAIGIGKSVVAQGTRAIAIGATTTTDTEYDATANTQATGNDAIAFGTSARATKNDTIAIGQGATANIENSIALGKSSTTTARSTVTKPTFKDDSGTDVTYNFDDNKAVVGVVSVGSDNGLRQIQYVATGNVSATSTDAINGSQLYLAVAYSGFNIKQNGAVAPISRVNNNNYVDFANGTYTTARGY
ncbi:hypothetical protein [Actinobacillus arthritidis]|uniref:hypothetical protein n=1 Tax=Actinobacillus arthritidis TaxID=157339 RepID=UPI002442457A|nr:hypothetical protein [Actinobacillus arthritidis]WGE88986.1 hypothetical protein NYR89_07965 [Actinobacillus arthritidis]